MTPALPASDQLSQPTRAMRVAARYLLMVLLVAPYAYLGILVAVAVHEFVGHGLVAKAVGGSFTGVELDFDGYGWAMAFPPPDGKAWKLAAINMGGVLTTMLTGIVLLLLSWRARRRPWLALPLLAVAANLLLEGSPYMFWDAVHAVPPGDIGPLVQGKPLARAACIVAGGAVMVTGIWCTTALMMWTAESWLNDGKRYGGWSRFAMLAVVGVGPGLVWFVFDWNQVVPGVDAWPNVVGLLIHILSAASLAPMRWRIEPVRPRLHQTRASIATGWALVSAAIAAIALWFRQGVTW